MKPPIEPFRIKVIEPVKLAEKSERENLIREVLSLFLGKTGRNLEVM